MHNARASLLSLLLPIQLAAQGWGTLQGTIVGEDSTPLPQTLIRIVGTGPMVFSGEGGQFQLAGVSPGDRLLEVRRLGYIAVRQTLQVGAGETLHVRVILALAPVALEAVAIEAEATLLPAMRGFSERRAQGNGRFFDRQEIARMQPRVFTDVLRRVPGVLIQSTNGAFGPNDAIRMSRTTGVMGARPCPVLFFMNGTPFPVTGDISINQYVIPEDIIAVEVYSGSAQVPSQFQSSLLNARCGVIVIWTRIGNEDDRPPRRPKE